MTLLYLMQIIFDILYNTPFKNVCVPSIFDDLLKFPIDGTANTIVRRIWEIIGFLPQNTIK